ncbi:alpha-amylase family glycosyl hydrolase [Sphingorhabdus sp.]|uniref:alpha-amylase family glycosyl hydrolase n=1 Tax=Sphingorhabdus sp. TaxID=1902408 RepID=UPI003CC5A0D0
MMRQLLFSAALAAMTASPLSAQSFRDRLPEDEVIYFVLPDRFANGDSKNDTGGIKGDRLKTGYDPTHKGFYHGGDLKGLLKRIDYIQGLGATAIWLAPVFKNKAVQGKAGDVSAGYHGYWVTDFTTVDPHFGTEADFKALVDAAHARGMKVYMDIIANHTADVISYRECPTGGCEYRSRADYPYQRRNRDGAAINAGFTGDSDQSTENFARLTDMDFAYDVVVPKAEAKVKVPEWLNDPKYYHNRGNTTFWNESATMGDFVGLDDIMTEHPHVVQGMIDIYGSWIDKYGVDGFRVDTARHVNPEFWQAFVPAMLARAKANNIPNFHIFGEIGGIGLEPGKLAVHTRVDKYPAVIDFAFRQAAVDTVAGTGATNKLWELFFQDPLYEGGADKARIQPTFVSNHDNGRFGYFVRKAFPQASDEEQLKRVTLAHAMLLTLRGVPTIYSGDEQGFAGDGWDQDAREDMFPSKTAVYNDNVLIGTKATTAQSNIDTSHPLYQKMAQLSGLRQRHAALRRGKQIVRNYADTPGLFAVSKIDPDDGHEIVVAFNTSDKAITVNVEVATQSTQFGALYGQCPENADTPGRIKLTLAPLDFAVCEAGAKE